MLFKPTCLNTSKICIIIDVTEVYIKKLPPPDLQQMTFSNYKNNNMFKGLIGISPSGTITFVSSLFSDSISDEELTRQRGILALLEKGRFCSGR